MMISPSCSTHLHEVASEVDEASRGPAELLLNGDIFDFRQRHAAAG